VVEAFPRPSLVPSKLQGAKHRAPAAIPQRFRGQLRTESIADFLQYVEEHKEENADGFIDADKMACSVIFNLGYIERAGNADDEALLISASHRRLPRPCSRSPPTPQPVRQLGSGIMEDGTATCNGSMPRVKSWRSLLLCRRSAPYHRQGTRERTALKATCATRSSMDSIEAAHAGKQPVANLLFTTVPYDGLGERHLRGCASASHR